MVYWECIEASSYGQIHLGVSSPNSTYQLFSTYRLGSCYPIYILHQVNKTSSRICRASRRLLYAYKGIRGTISICLQLSLINFKDINLPLPELFYNGQHMSFNIENQDGLQVKCHYEHHMYKQDEEQDYRQQ